MRNRTRADGDDPRERPEQREDTRRVRIPKIQYRFLKEVEENGVNGETRVAALAMADKIKRYPLEPQHVMASWERFTKKAIEEFKSGRGDNAARDRQHTAYAVVFSALQDRPQAASIGELKQHIEVFSARHPPVSQERDHVAVVTARQENLSERQRLAPERHIENSLAAVRSLAAPLRESVEARARDLILWGQTPESARHAMPAAARELQAHRRAGDTIRVLSLAIVATAPDHPALLNEAAQLSPAQRGDIEADVRARAERYVAGAVPLVDVRKDAVGAAVRNAVAPSTETHREALVLAVTREQLEQAADPMRQQWSDVGEHLAAHLG